MALDKKISNHRAKPAKKGIRKINNSIQQK